jgi:glycerol kinase
VNYFGVIDEGTTSTRAMIFDENGKLLSMSQKKLKTIYPKAGWVEQSAEEIYTKTLEALEEAKNKCGCSIDFLGITNQRETVVAWDSKTGKPLYNAIVWRDKRGQPICEKIKSSGYENLVREKTGLLLDPYFSASKMKWLVDNVQEIKDKITKHELMFGTVDSYLVWKLTGNHLTEVSNASRTLLFNLSTLSWDKELLEMFDIPPETLPAVKPSAYKFGSSAYGEICGILGDQQSSLFGNRCYESGEVKCTYGTGAFVLANIGNSSISNPFGLLKTVAWKIGNDVTYALEGSILASGENVTWIKKIGLISEESEIEPLAKSVLSSEGVYFVPALDGIGAPKWIPQARGAFLGLSSFHTKAHLIRAILDAMAFSTVEVVDAFRKSGIFISKISVDGGGAQNSLLVQILADASNVPVERPRFHEMTAYGAFLMSGIGAGAWTFDDLKRKKNSADLFNPQNDLSRIYSDWKKAEEFSINWSKKR